MSTTKPDAYAALRYKEFNIFLLVRFALICAWTMQFVVVEWEVYKITGDKLSLGYIGLTEAIAVISVALIAGHVVDNNEKRGILIKATAGFLCISFGLFLLTWPAVVGGWSKNMVLAGIYTCVFLGGVVRSFIGPTVFSLLSLIVPKALYPNAATWNSTMRQISSMLGPALGGGFIYWIGVHWSMCIIVFFVLLALMFTTLIPKKPIVNTKRGEPILDSLKGGFGFMYKNKIILGVLALDMFAVLFGGAVALLPVFAKDILNVGAWGFGILRAAPAVGAFVTMFICAHLPMHKNAGKKLLLAIIGFGITIIIFALSGNLWLSVLALVLYGATDGVSVVVRQTILQLRTPDDMRGRVASVNSIFISSSNELGAFESGFTAHLMGTVPSVVFGGCMTLLTVFGMAWAIPALRRLDLGKDIEEHSK